jgi:hypothetical protein
MSCWVVPAIAAEFWGVTLDVVWDRIRSDLVPHKTEQGFVFIDVDPWGPCEGAGHVPPPTFVASSEPAEELGAFAISLDAAESRMLMRDLPPLRGTPIYHEEIKLITGTALDEDDQPVRDSFRELDSSSFELTDEECAELASAELEQLRDAPSSATAVALRENDSNDESYGEEEYDSEDSGDEDLPELDGEESATFTRLSWQDVRQSVGRTRKPPPRS